MNVHEYQAKQLFREFGVAVPEGGLAETPAEAEVVAKGLATKVVVVKAQIHAGGRGKAGGVKVITGGPEAAQAAADEIVFGVAEHPLDGRVQRLDGAVLVEGQDEERFVPLRGRPQGFVDALYPILAEICWRGRVEGLVRIAFWVYPCELR